MKISIVTSLYRSAPDVRGFHAAYSRLAGGIASDYEIVFVDDGSPDDCASIVEELHRADPRVRLIKLSRNFGQSAAMYAGLQRAAGELVFTADADLEDPPELLTRFHDLMRGDPSVQSVYGYMESRQGKLGERFWGWLFYRLLSATSHDRIPHQVWSRLMTRRYLDALLGYSEYHLFWSGLFHHVGFRQIGVPVVRNKTGRTSYSFGRRLELAISAITSYSDRSLYLIFLAGLSVSALSGLLGLVLLIRYFMGNLVSGWMSIMLSVWFLGGMMTCSLGLIGLYVGRTFIQAKNRPHYIIEREL